MKNPIKSLDDLLTSGANAAVHAWNFTTGRTKSDLSTLLITAGSIVQIGGSFVTPLFIYNPIFTIPFYFTLAINKGLSNYYQESRELKIKDKEIKDLYIEANRIGSKSVSIVAGGFSAIDFGFSRLIDKPEESESMLMQSIGFGLIAAGYLVSAVDSPPPRKNCFSRALDKASEFIANYKLKHAYAPAVR
jgi:hypothetical protein